MPDTPSPNAGTASADTASHYDIIIVGGGMVGLSLAIGLSKTSLRVLVLEARDFSYIDTEILDQRSTALSAGTQRLLANYGLWPSLKPFANPINTIHVSEKGRFGAVNIKHTDCAVDALGYVIENQQFLQQALAYLSNTDVTLTSPAALQDLVEIEASDTTHAYQVITSAGNFTCSLLVATDGVHSPVAALLDIPASQTAYDQHAITVNVKTSVNHQQRAFERFTSHGPLAFLPMQDGYSSVVWCVPEHKLPAIMALDEAHFNAVLQQEFGRRLGRIEQCGTRAHFPLQLTERHNAATSGNAIILGNALHNLHPVAGQGFNLSMRDIEQLVTLLAADLASAKVRFANERHRDQQRVIKATDTLVRLFSNDLLPAMAARHLGLMGLDYIPPLKNAIARQGMGISASLPTQMREQ